MKFALRDFGIISLGFLSYWVLFVLVGLLDLFCNVHDDFVFDFLLSHSNHALPLIL